MLLLGWLAHLSTSDTPVRDKVPTRSHTVRSRQERQTETFRVNLRLLFYGGGSHRKPP